jgi:hypothetical protein
VIEPASKSQRRLVASCSGDFARGGFWYDASQPESPLRYLVTWNDLGQPTKKMHAKALAFPRGAGNQ